MLATPLAMCLRWCVVACREQCQDKPLLLGWSVGRRANTIIFMQRMAPSTFCNAQRTPYLCHCGGGCGCDACNAMTSQLQLTMLELNTQHLCGCILNYSGLTHVMQTHQGHVGQDSSECVPCLRKCRTVLQQALQQALQIAIDLSG